MFEDGLIDEAKKLRNLSLSRTAYQAIGYKESFDFIDGNINKDDCIYKTIIMNVHIYDHIITLNVYRLP